MGQHDLLQMLLLTLVKHTFKIIYCNSTSFILKEVKNVIKIIGIGIILVLFAVGLSGCSEFIKEDDSIESKFIGIWEAKASGETELGVFQFLPNGSFSVKSPQTDWYSGNTTIITVWGTYAMTKETLILENQGQTNALEYSFSNNDKILTLITVGDNIEFAVLTKK